MRQSHAFIFFTVSSCSVLVSVGVQAQGCPAEDPRRTVFAAVAASLKIQPPPVQCGVVLLATAYGNMGLTGSAPLSGGRTVDDADRLQQNAWVLGYFDSASDLPSLDPDASSGYLNLGGLGHLVQRDNAARGRVEARVSRCAGLGLDVRDMVQKPGQKRCNNFWDISRNAEQGGVALVRLRFYADGRVCTDSASCLNSPLEIALVDRVTPYVRPNGTDGDTYRVGRCKGPRGIEYREYDWFELREAYGDAGERALFLNKKNTSITKN